MVPVSGDPLQNAIEEVLNRAFIADQQETDDVRCKAKDPRFCRHRLVRGLMPDGGGGHHGSRHADEQGKAQEFLLDTDRSARVELPGAEEVAFREFVVLLDLPPRPIDGGDAGARELRTPKGSENDGPLAFRSRYPDGPKLERLGVGHRMACRRVDHDPAIVTTFGQEVSHRGEGVRAGHPDDEVDPGIREQPEEFEGRVTAVENEDIPGPEPIQQQHELLPLRGIGAADDQILRNPGAQVEKRADEGLRAVGTLRDAEDFRQLGATLEIDLGAVYRQEASARGATDSSAELLFESVGESVDEDSNRGRRQLSPGLAVGSTAHRSVGGERETEGPRLIPKRIEELEVAATTTVGDHVESESQEQPRGERTATAECPRCPTDQGNVLDRLDQLNELSKAGSLTRAPRPWSRRDMRVSSPSARIGKPLSRSHSAPRTRHSQPNDAQVNSTKGDTAAPRKIPTGPKRRLTALPPPPDVAP